MLSRLKFLASVYQPRGERNTRIQVVLLFIISPHLCSFLSSIDTCDSHDDSHYGSSERGRHVLVLVLFTLGLV